MDKGTKRKFPIATSCESLQLKRDDEEVEVEELEGDDICDGKMMNQFIKVKKVATESTTLSKKPVRRFTDQDFERETKELTVKKLRLDVKLKEEQNKLCQQLQKGLSRILKAVDVFLDTQPRVTVCVIPFFLLLQCLTSSVAQVHGDAGRGSVVHFAHGL